MTFLYEDVIRRESACIVSAYDANRGGRVPWSDRWSVGTVARHVAGTQHVVSQIVAGRPDADFSLFETLDAPAKDAPEFPNWFSRGTDLLVTQLGSVDPNEPCWNWHEGPGGRVAFWGRRMAQEALVHRWDAEAGAGLAIAPIDSDVAVDGIDEFLDVFVAAARAQRGSPAGPTVAVEAVDTTARWNVELPEGRRIVHVGDHSAEVHIRGGAADILLYLWGRTDSGVEVTGPLVDRTDIAALLPSL